MAFSTALPTNSVNMSILDDITASPSKTRVSGFRANTLNLKPVMRANLSLIPGITSSRFPLPTSIFIESARSRAYLRRTWSSPSPISALYWSSMLATDDIPL